MDNLSVHQKHSNNQANKANKKSKKKKQPFKVVYISNPLRVTLTADNFRARVQELTGRDSNVADAAGVAGFGDASYDTTSPVAAAAAAVGPRPDSNKLGDEYSFGAVAVAPLPLYDQMFGEAFSAAQAPGNFPGLYYEPRTEGGFSHAA